MAERLNLTLDFRHINSQQNELTSITPNPGRLTFDGQTYQFTAGNLIDRGIIGTGTYGVCSRMEHDASHKIMAVKRVRAHEIDKLEREKMLRELKIIIDTQNCEDVVRFYGAIFQDGDCWIAMELMDCSLDKFYRSVYNQKQKLPEHIIGFIGASVVRALNYLKEVHNIIHRDVKPSNILLNTQGFVKLCDFGISGYLVDSIARTQDVGCQIYMAPERLSERKYGIRSDVWSLGISLVEICIGHFPYLNWNSVFDQLQAVVHGDPPFLQTGDYSVELVNFVNRCLIKDTTIRPTFAELITDPFYIKYNIQDPVEMQKWRKEFGDYVAQFLPTSPIVN
uniref:Protein kinase domain-containing protein n=1 Tax=Panagrolaimus sp. JU765 TaxID=591449 RepID=A0AC34Q5Y8_9BILA